jgi:hypothetical protein
MNEKERLAVMDRAARFRDAAAHGADSDSAPMWQCGRGHQWDDALDSAQNIRCMNCASQRRDNATRRLREIAEARGGALASSDGSDYADHTAPLTWQCAHGHEWRARAHDAQRLWCPVCARTVFAAYR